MSLVSIFLISLLSENIVLTKFLGICPVIGTSRNRKTALSMSLAVMLIVILSSIITYFVYYYFLKPYNLVFIQSVVFVLIIAIFVQILEGFIKKNNQTLYKNLGIFLPLITTNCAVLGIILLNIANEYSFLEMLIYAFGSTLGFTLVMFVFSSLREKMERAPIPKNFKNLPIAFIMASIMSMIFSRFIF